MGNNNIEEEDQVPADACQQCSSENRNIFKFICPHFFKSDSDSCQQCSSEMQMQEEADEDVAHIEGVLDGGENNNIEEEDSVPANACQQCSSENRKDPKFICPHFFKFC